MNGAELITLERTRQIESEGWSASHDDSHAGGELGQAAQHYVDAAAAREVGISDWARVPWGWPWCEDWWKPSDNPIRSLVKAGALIAAEIDRLKRKGY